MGPSRIGSTLKTTPAVTCIKIILMAFNFIFWITGIAILALGIWMKVQLYMYMELTTIYYSEAPFVLMGTGALIVLVGSLACCCTAKGNACFLYLYSMFLILVFIVELSAGIAGFVYKGKMETGFKDGMTQALNRYLSDESKKEALDTMQKTLKCCGVQNYTTWFYTPFARQYGQNGTRAVPTSCCRDPANCPNSALPPFPAGGNGTDYPVYVDGCWQTVTVFMKKNFGIMGGVVIGFSFLQLFGAMLSCCLARTINKNKYEQVA